MGTPPQKTKYTMSDAAKEQRYNLARRKRWNTNLRVLHEKLEWKVDEYKLVDEIATYLKKTFTIDQLIFIFQDEFEGVIASLVEEDVNKKLKEKYALVTKENATLKEEIAALKEENVALKEENAALKEDNKEPCDKLHSLLVALMKKSM
jgi:FtsZ-binding cell division protein ZapB